MFVQSETGSTGGRVLTSDKQHEQPKGLRAKLCLRLARLFLTDTLRQYGFRSESHTRFDSDEEYVADRVEQTRVYQELFRSFCTYEGKMVPEI